MEEILFTGFYVVLYVAWHVLILAGMFWDLKYLV